jgi:hypothetical protein
MQNRRNSSFLHALREFRGFELWHVVQDFHLLAEVFAGDIAPPLCGKPFGDPAVDTAIEHRDVTVSQALHSRSRQLRTPSIVIT